MKEKPLEIYENCYGCWIVCSHKSRARGGYSIFNRDGKKWMIHRWIYQKYHGEIPKGILVCHTCDNPSCINPDHLFIGTHRDNLIDAYQKGRLADQKGENNKHSKLTIKQIGEIRKAKMSQKEISKKYKICQSNVSRIKTRSRWNYSLQGIK